MSLHLQSKSQWPKKSFSFTVHICHFHSHFIDQRKSQSHINLPKRWKVHIPGALIDSNHDNKLFPLDFCLQPHFLCPITCTITKMFLVSALCNLWHQSRIPLRTRCSCFCSLCFPLILMLGLPWVPRLALYPSLSYSWNERASRRCYTHNQNNLYPLFLLPMVLLLFLLS